MAQSLVGRRVEVDQDPPLSATVDAVQELTPATDLVAMAMPDGRIPMWSRFRLTLVDVSLGGGEVAGIDLDAVDLSLTAAVGGRLRVARVDAVGRLTQPQLDGWVDQLALPYVVRLRDGRLEVSDRRIERWLAVAISVTAADQQVRVETGMIRLFGRWYRAPEVLRRIVERSVAWLPRGARISEVVVEGEELHVVAAMEGAQLPVDVARIITDLGTGSRRSVLRIVTGW